MLQTRRLVIMCKARVRSQGDHLGMGDSPINFEIRYHEWCSKVIHIWLLLPFFIWYLGSMWTSINCRNSYLISNKFEGVSSQGVNGGLEAGNSFLTRRAGHHSEITCGEHCALLKKQEPIFHTNSKASKFVLLLTVQLNYCHFGSSWNSISIIDNWQQCTDILTYYY